MMGLYLVGLGVCAFTGSPILCIAWLVGFPFVAAAIQA